MMLLLCWMKREVCVWYYLLALSSSRRAYSWDDDDRQLYIYVDACRPIRYRSHTHWLDSCR